MGDYKFYSYDAFTNNCQNFITAFLKSNNMLNAQVNIFINQNVDQLSKNVSWFSKHLAGVATDLDAFRHGITGKGITSLHTPEEEEKDAFITHFDRIHPQPLGYGLGTTDYIKHWVNINNDEIKRLGPEVMRHVNKRMNQYIKYYE